MNIRLAQFNPTVGDISGNADLVYDQFKEAEAGSADLLITTELVTCGYPAMDLLERPSFMSAVYEQNERLISSTGSTALLFGTITPSPPGSSRALCNSAILAQNGKEVARVNKTLLPSYDIFDEYRYFEPNSEIKPVKFGGIKLGITICEDIWYNENEYQYHRYSINPAEQLKEQGADMLINVSASPFSRNKPELRRQMLYSHVRRLGVPILFVNQCGANTEIIFDGDTMAMDRHGEVISRAALFQPDTIDVQVANDGSMSSVSNSRNIRIPGKEEAVFYGLCRGLEDYISKTGMEKKVLVGLSGGIDSAVTAVVAAEAIGSENVTAITMPSEFSSGGSISDSEKLAENLGITLHELPVKSIYDQTLQTLNPLFEGTEFSVAEENIQSRIRGMMLMAISNKFGNMLLNTGNKSEMAVGYATLYGDMAGGLSILSDVYKTEVYDIAHWLNHRYYGREVIPGSIITKPPSAELRPDQKDTDSLPEYDVLDGILTKYIEEQKSASEIASEGFDEQVVHKVIRLVDLSEHKRKQAPPGLRVSPKAFGSGRRMPIVQKWTEQQLHPDKFKS